MGGVGKLLTTLRAVRRPEPARCDAPPGDADVSTLYVFEGMKDHFANLHGYDELLHDELRSMTRGKWLSVAESYKDFPIAINVRMGNDFRRAMTNEDYYTKGAIRTPLDWFVDSLTFVRKLLGFEAKAFVVSDGTRSDLSKLLEINNVEFLRPGCAISDLLALSQAKILIASGGSSFSAWASFLGQMPTISHPGQSLNWFNIDNRKGSYVGEFDPRAPASAFLESLKSLKL